MTPLLAVLYLLNVYLDRLYHPDYNGVNRTRFGGMAVPLGFAVIGCGAISRMHLESIASISDARLVAAVDSNIERAQAVVAEFGGRAFGDYKQALALPEVDVVCILTPSGARRDIAVDAAEAKKHVIVEKPIEITIERVDEIIDACKRNGVTLSGIFQFRFKPAWQFVRNAVVSGRLGKLILGDAYNKWWRSQAYYDSTGWRGTWALDGGGALMNQGIHAVDLLQWMMGDVVEVSAYTGTLAHERIEVEDTAVATLKFASGALGVIEGTTSVYPGYPMRIELHGTEGSVVVTGDYISEWSLRNTTDEEFEEVRRFYAPEVRQSTASDPAQTDCTWHRLQILDVVNSILNGTEPMVPGTEGRKSVEIINAIYKSSQICVPVKLPLGPEADA